MSIPEGVWLVLTFAFSVILSIWSLGFLLFFIFLVVFEVAHFKFCKEYKCIERLNYILASFYGFMIGRSILCEDHNHFNLLYENPRSMWQDCKGLCGFK